MSEKVYVQVGVKGRALPSGGEAGQILQKASDKDFDLIWTTPAGGTSANIPQPAIIAPYADTPAGDVGTGVSFARHDHKHPMNVDDTVNPQMDGTADPGDDAYYARRDHVHPRNTENAVVQLSDITLNTSWTTVTANQHYTKSVTIASGTSNSKIDLCAEYATILQMDNDGTLAVYIENNNGTFTAHAVGEKPTASLTFQVFRTETI